MYMHHTAYITHLQNTHITHTHTHAPPPSLCCPSWAVFLLAILCDRSDFACLLAAAELLSKALVSLSEQLAQSVGEAGGGGDKEGGALLPFSGSCSQLWKIPEGGIEGLVLCKRVCI